MPKLRIGVIGAGYWGPNLIRNFHENPKCEVLWICDADEERLSALSKRYPDIATTRDAEVIFHSKDVDAVVIATPSESHYELTRRAIDAGKHVLVEKPLTTSLETSKELVKLADSKDLKLMVGHVFLFNPAVQYMKQALDSGLLGELYYIYFTRTNLGPVRRDVNAWWDLAPHDVSILLYLMGELPETVAGRGASFINPPVEDVAFGSFRFPRGVFGNIHVSWLDPRKVRQIVMVGSQKMLVFDDIDPTNPIRLYDKGIGPNVSKTMINDDIVLFRKSIFEGTCTLPEIKTGEPLRAECEAFIDYVLLDRPQPSTGPFSAQVVGLMESVNESLRQNGAVQQISPTSLPQTPSHQNETTWREGAPN